MAYLCNVFDFILLLYANALHRLDIPAIYELKGERELIDVFDKLL